MLGKFIKLFTVWWSIVGSSPIVIKTLKRITFELDQHRLAFKKLMKHAKAIPPERLELLVIKKFYMNYIIYDPIGPGSLKIMMKNISRKRELLLRNRFYLDTNKPSSCVIGVDVNSDDYNKIVLVSKNTKKLFEAEDALPDFFSLKNIMPKLIANVHNGFVDHFKKHQIMTIINEYQYLMAVTANKKALSIKCCVKMCFQDSTFYLIAYIQVVDSMQSIITNNFGEIDSFGENFSEMTEIKHNFAQERTHLNILMFIPSLIPCFLEHFYDIPDFWVNDFDMSCLENTYLFVYKNQKQLIGKLSILLKRTKHSKRELGKALYSFLSHLKFQDIEKVFQISLVFKEFDIKKKFSSLNFVEMKVSKIVNVTHEFQAVNFESNFSFLSKLNVNADLEKSIKNFEKRSSNEIRRNNTKEKLNKIVKNFEQQENEVKKHFFDDEQTDEKKENFLRNDTNENNQKRIMNKHRTIKKANQSHMKNANYFQLNKHNSLISNALSVFSKRNPSSDDLKTFEFAFHFGIIFKLKSLVTKNQIKLIQNKWINFQLQFSLKKCINFGEENIMQIGKFIRNHS